MTKKGFIQFFLVASISILLLTSCARGTSSKLQYAQKPRISYECTYHNNITKAVYRAFHEEIAEAKVAAWSKCKMGRSSQGCRYITCVKIDQD